MAKALLSLALFSAIAFSSCLGQGAPLATLYANTGCTGAFVKLQTDRYTSDLSQLGFDNRANSVRLTGTWMFYDSTIFNPRGNEAMEYIFKPRNECVDFEGIGGYVSSVKFAGNNANYAYDTITFYEFTYFQGREEYADHDLPNLALVGNIASLIVTGSSESSTWTIYDRPNYGGNAICLKLTPSDDFEPGFVADTKDLSPPVPHGTIASVRKGCHTANIRTIDVSTAIGAHNNLAKL